MSTPIIRVGVAVDSVHDGDTIWLLVPIHGVWPDISGAKATRVKTRVAHCNAAELSTPAGPPARDAVAAWLADPERGQLTALGYGRENYGRWLADVQDAQGSLLSAFVLTLPGSQPMALAEQLRRTQ